MLIQIDVSDINNTHTQQYIDLNNIPNRVKEIIKKNGLSVKGQLRIIDQLRADINIRSANICWSGTKPKKKQLDYVLELAWNNLMSETESRGITFKQLSYLTHSYGAWETPIIKLIEENSAYLAKNYQERHPNVEITEDKLVQFEDTSIKLILQVVRHWFEYKVPKFLSTINSLQELVCTEFGITPGDYTLFASIIENNFIPNHLTILAEYGIPHTAIQKICKSIPSDINDEDLISYIKNNDLHLTKSLIEYEKNKIESLYV